MGLDPVVLAALFDSKMADKVDGYADSDNRDAMKAGLFAALAEAVIEHVKAAAVVTGEDSNGDTHELTIE